jgi:hypothetical protein
LPVAVVVVEMVAVVVPVDLGQLLPQLVVVVL